MEWQPIETAPKMKTILLFGVTSRGKGGAPTNWKMETGFYHEGWTDAREINSSAWNWGGHHPHVWEATPTHWQPLPDPPSGEQSDE